MKVGLQPLIREGLTDAEALEFFRSKGLAPPDRRFDYRDWTGADHARGFVVAKGMQDDLLEMIRGELDTAIAEGRTYQQFVEVLEPKLRAQGWWGRQEVEDPLTGERRQVQLGSRNRLRVIFDTNLKTSFAAGRWARIQRTKRQFPYLLYRQVQRPTKRKEHEPFHDILLPVDNPFWLTHFPPNGYFCACIVRQISEGARQRLGLEVSPDPDVETRPVMNNRTGEIEEVPMGITPGFSANPGATFLDLADRHALVAGDLDQAAAALELGAILEARARGLRDGRESMTVVDRQTNELVDWTVGDSESVTMSDRMIRWASAPDGAVTVIHNHPGPTSYTLSAPDFGVLQSFPGMDRVIAVGHDGSIYAARKLVPRFSIDGGQVDPHEVATLAARLMLDLAERGAVDPADLSEAHSFVVARSLDKTGVIDYQHALTLRSSQLYARNRQVIEYLAERIGERIRGGDR